MGKEIRAGGLFVDLSLGVATLQTHARQAISTLQQVEKGFGRVAEGAATGAKAAAKALAGLATAVVTLERGLSKLASVGEVAGAIRENFEKLGGSATQLEAARKASVGLVDSFELMRIANDGLLKQIPGFRENFGQIADLGTRIADSLGIEAADGIQRVVDALSTAKTQALSSIGITVEQEKAYRAYADSINVTADSLTKAQKKEALQIAAINQLVEATERLLPAGGSVSDAQDAVATAMSEATKEIGIQINQNDALAKIWRDVEKAINDVNWKDVGRDISAIAEIISRNLVPALSSAISEVENLATGFRVLMTALEVGSLSEATDLVANQKFLEKQADASKEAVKAIKELQSIQVFDGDKFVLTAEGMERAKAATDRLREAMASGNVVTKDADKILESAEKTIRMYDGTIEKSVEPTKRFGEASEKALKTTGEEAKKATEELARFQEEWQKVVSDQSQESLKSQIDAAIESLDSVSVSNLTEELRRSVQDGFVAEWQDAINSGAISLEEVTKAAGVEGQKVVDEYAQQLQERSEEAYKNSIDTWRGLFENAITGVTFDLESALKQVAVGFAAELAHAIFGSLGGINIGSPADLGGAIFQSIFGGSGGAGGLLGGSDGLLGAGILGAGAGGLLGSLGGGAGVLLSTGEVIAAGSAIPAGATAVGSAALPATGILGALGPMGIAALAGGALIGGNAFGIRDTISDLFGGGPSHPETLARRDMIGFLEEKLGRNIVLGSDSRFNDKGWGDGFDKFSIEAQQSAYGIADALKLTLGVTEDVADQIALVLLEDTGGSIEKLGEMFGTLGISAEEAKEAIIQAGLEAGETWLEIEGKLQGIDRATQGAASSAATAADAFAIFAEGNASGMDDIANLTAIAQKAQEQGIATLQQLRAHLEATFGSAKVAPLFAALDTYGITSLDQLANASTRTAGAIIANMQATGFVFEGLIEDIQDTIAAVDDLARAAEEIGGISTSAQTSIDTPKAPEVAAAKTIRRGAGDPSIASAMAPRRNRRINMGEDIGVRQINVTVNAPGGEAGIEADIVSYMQHVEERAVRRAVNTIADMAERGGGFL